MLSLPHDTRCVVVTQCCLVVAVTQMLAVAASVISGRGHQQVITSTQLHSLTELHHAVTDATPWLTPISAKHTTTKEQLAAAASDFLHSTTVMISSTLSELLQSPCTLTTLPIHYNLTNLVT